MKKYSMINGFKNIVKKMNDNRQFIFRLARNDFRTKYAGAYLGIFWAFVQPVIMILLYWIVFQVVFQSGAWNGYPYVLGLMTGLVPWFYFSESFCAATNALTEYSYLVKKVVFQVQLLPAIKIVSTLYVHLFFVCFTVAVFAVNGYMPSIYLVQIVYYLLAMMLFVLGLSYITSAISVFMKDLIQLIQICMQVWMWATPILWNIAVMPQAYQKYGWLLKLNPLYYLIQGYRDAWMNHIWFWERPGYMCYFWTVTIGMLWIGKKVFRRLQPHFADVL